MPAFCPLCARDDQTEQKRTPDGRLYAICTSKDHGPSGYVWEPSPPREENLRSDGLGAELDIWDRLLECVPADEKAHPYGDVEDRFFEKHPEESAVLLKKYGHRWRDPDHRSGHYSMSAYLASRLRELAKEGHLRLTWGPATGKWTYNEIISHWERT